MVQLPSKTDEEMSYAERIGTLIRSGGTGAILIKLSDNEDNAQADRQLPSRAGLTARYAASMQRLRDAVTAMGYTGRDAGSTAFAQGSVGLAVMGEVGIAVGRLRQFAAGLGVDETTQRLIALMIWTDSAERTTEEKVAEVLRRLIKIAGA